MTALTHAPRAKKSTHQTEGRFWESLALLAADNPHAGKVLDQSMEILASLYSADRTWLGRYNNAWTHFWGVSDWVAPGVATHLQEMQGVSVDTILQAHQTFLRGENVLIPDVDKLPRQARSLQAELRRESVRSTLAVPVFHDGNLIGFFGFDYVGKLAAWTAADLDRLPAVAKFLGALLHRAMTSSLPEQSGGDAQKPIHVNEPNAVRTLDPEAILFIKAEGDYSRIHTKDGPRPLERRSLKAWIAQLPRERFLRVHQSYLVNGARIARVDRGSRWQLHLHNVAEPIPVGRAFRHAVRLHLGF